MGDNKLNPRNDWNRQQRTHDDTEPDLLDEESKKLLKEMFKND